MTMMMMRKTMRCHLAKYVGASPTISCNLPAGCTTVSYDDVMRMLLSWSYDMMMFNIRSYDDDMPAAHQYYMMMIYWMYADADMMIKWYFRGSAKMVPTNQSQSYCAMMNDNDNDICVCSGYFIQVLWLIYQQQYLFVFLLQNPRPLEFGKYKLQNTHRPSITMIFNTDVLMLPNWLVH